MTNKELQELLKKFPDNARVRAGGGGINDEIEEDFIFFRPKTNKEYMLSDSFNSEDVIEIFFDIGEYW